VDFHHLASGRRHLAALDLHPEHCCGGHTRLFFRWEGLGTNRRQLEAERHCPLMADTALGGRVASAVLPATTPNVCVGPCANAKIIFRLLPEDFGWIIGSRPKDDSPPSRHAVVGDRWKPGSAARD